MTNKERIERLEECIKRQEARDKRIIDGWKRFKKVTPKLDNLFLKDLKKEGSSHGCNRFLGNL